MEIPRHKLVSIKASPMSDMARWMLEHYELPFDEECHVPLVHAAFTHLVGAGAELPAVVSPDGVWHGSKGFITGLDGKSRPGMRLLGEHSHERQANLELVDALHRFVFIPSRRYFYNHMLPRKAPVFRAVTTGVPLAERAFVWAFYRLWRAGMRSGLDVSDELIAQAPIDIRHGFDLVDQRLLSSNQPYMHGPQPGPMDIVFSSMAALAILPDAHPVKRMPTLAECPDELANFIRSCRDRPAGRLVEMAYQYRANASAKRQTPTSEDPLEKRLGFFSNPATIRWGANAARRLRSRWWLGRRRRAVLGFRDVQTVLSNDVDFRIRPINQSRINDVNDGDFILGLDRGEKLVRERDQLYAAVSRNDVPRSLGLVTTEAIHILDATRDTTQKLDVVNGYARLIAARTAALVFGVWGPSEADLTRVIRAMFHHTFLNLSNDEKIRSRGMEAAAMFKQWVLMEINARQNRAHHNDGHFGDDMLGRMLAFQKTSGDALDNDGVRRNISGLVVGAIDTTATSVANIAYVLLTRPDIAAQFQRDINDPARVRGWCWEILRLMPHNPIVLRQTAGNVRLGRTRMKPDTRVIVATASAMQDPLGFPQPGILDPTRPEGNYMHFGYGLHACSGREINRVQIPTLVKLLFERKPTLVDKLYYRGPFPDRLVVKLNG